MPPDAHDPGAPFPPDEPGLPLSPGSSPLPGADAVQAAADGDSPVLFGTSSWSAQGWRGVFYPERMNPRDQLTFYARHFPTVEADVTYYRIPSAGMTDGWNHKTPAGFVLSAKFPRSIVHAGSGARPDADKVLVPEAVWADVEAFLTAMNRLDAKCGPLVLQFPYFNRQAFPEPQPFLERLDAFLEQLPGGFRYAVEIRNKTWLTASYLDILRRHRCAPVLLDLNYMPHPDTLVDELDLVTTDFAYIRLIGNRKEVEEHTTTFDRIVVDRTPGLRRWADLIRTLSRQVDRTLVYANNHYAGHAPATVGSLATAIMAG